MELGSRLKALGSSNHDLRGFTLLELMIVIAIIGILAAIAIPQYSVYRTRAYNTAAYRDLRNAITTQEAYFAEHGSYTSSIGDLTGQIYGLTTSVGVILTVNTGNPIIYNMQAANSQGDRTYAVRGPGGKINPM